MKLKVAVYSISLKSLLYGHIWSLNNNFKKWLYIFIAADACIQFW